MEFTPKAVFFCATNQEFNACLNQEVEKFIGQQPISPYALLFPDLQKMSQSADGAVGDAFSRLRGEGDLKLSAQIPGKALRVVSIVVAQGWAEEEEKALDRFNEIVRLTQHPGDQPNIHFLITDKEIGNLQSQCFQIICAKGLEQGLVMKDEEYLAVCAALVSALIIIPTDDDLSRLMFGVGARTVCAIADITRIPGEPERSTLCAMFQRGLAGKIENDARDFKLWDLVSDCVSVSSAHSPGSSDSEGVQHEASVTTIPQLRIPIYASGAGRAEYVFNRLAAFNAGKYKYLEQMQVKDRNLREKTWGVPLALQGEARLYMRIQEGMRTWRLGALGKELERVETRLRNEIQEPSVWHFVRDLKPFSCTAFPFTKFWLICFLLPLASAGFAALFVLDRAIQITTFGVALLFWPLLIAIALLLLRGRSSAMRSVMQRDLGSVRTFVTQNSSNFEMARLNFIRRVLLRVVTKYIRIVTALRNRISAREFSEEHEYQRSLGTMKAALGESSFVQIEGHMRAGLDAALDKALDKIDMPRIAAVNSSNAIFQESFRQFVASREYEDITGLFLKRRGQDLRERLTRPQLLPCGQHEVETELARRQTFILSPVPADTAASFVDRAGSDAELPIVHAPAPDSWIVVHVAPVEK